MLQFSRRLISVPFQSFLFSLHGRLFVVAFALLTGLPSPAAVQATTWVNVLGGSYTKAGNWNPADVPDTLGESATFNLADTYTVDILPSIPITVGNLDFGDGNVTFSAGNSLGDATVNTSSMFLSQGNLSLARDNVSTDIHLIVDDQIQIRGGSTLAILDGATVMADSLSIGIDDNNVGGFDGTILVDGSGSTLSTTGEVRLGTGGPASTGTLTIQNGATVSGPSGYIGFSGSTGIVTLDGSGSTWTASDSLYVGGSDSSAGGTGTLTITDQGLVDVANTLKIWGPGTVSLDGGSIATQTLDHTEGGTFNFLSGSLTINDGLLIGSSTIFPVSTTLNSDRHLATAGTTTITAFRTLTLDGGSLQTGDLSINGTLQFNSGTLGITGAGGLTVGAGGPFGSALSIGTGQNLGVTNTLTVDAGATLSLTTGGNISAGGVSNSGQLHGNGTINGPLTNNVGGEVQGLVGNNLVLTGSGNTNNGQITLSGGQVYFSEDFTNSSIGLVIGNGTLRTDAGTTNNGTMAFSATVNVIGDMTNNVSGTIISAGGTTTFFDDVTNNGEIRTNANSFSVYFGSYSGNGDTGTGTVIMEGDLKPGSSPGTMAFGGDLSFGPAAGLEIEIGGLLAGSEYDQVTVANDISLGGTLDVSLIVPFSLNPGQSFEIIDVDGLLSGTFSGLPEGGLVGNFGGTNLLITYAGGDGNDVTLLAALPGDFDINGDVDGNDFLLWQLSGSPDPLSQSDLNDWQTNYGMVATLSAASTAVPNRRRRSC